MSDTEQGRPTVREGDGRARPTTRDAATGANDARRGGDRAMAREGVARATERESGAARATAREGGEAARHRQRFRLPDELAERFDYIHDLGAGSQAPVLLCTDRLSGDQVAVKLYHDGGVDTDVLAALSQGDPAHVVAPREFGTADGDPWEVMEYFPLGTLDELMRDGTVGGVGFARAFVTEVVDALEHLHGLDIKHRDLKPANIFVRSLDPLDLVIGDFGISIRSAGTVAATVRGTWAYAAPEAGSPLVKEQADWWSIGIIAHELLTGRHPLADANGLLPSDNQVRASVFDGAVDASAVDDARWRLLLDGLLTWKAEHRWGAQQVREWADGRSPTVHPGGPVPSAQAVKANVKPFPLAGTGHTEPAALARAMTEHWDEAGDRLRGRGLEELRGFLRDNDLDEEAVREITDRGRESYVLLAMQGAFLPGAAPRFRGRALDGATLTALARAAQQGDQRAAAWIREFRLERVLGEAARYSSDGSRLAVADDRLARWGDQVEETATRLERTGDIASVVSSQRVRWEGALLHAVLDDDASREVREAGLRLAADRAPVPGWAAGLASDAAGIDAARADDTATALIVTALLPAARDIERQRLAAVAEAEAQAQRAEREAARAAERAARTETLAARRRRAGREFWRRLWVIIPYALIATWLSTVPLGSWWMPAWEEIWLPLAWAGGSTLALSLGVFLWETYIARVRLFARSRLLIAAALTSIVLWWTEHTWINAPPPLTEPTWWLQPTLVFAGAFTSAAALSRVFGPRLGAAADRASDDRQWRQDPAPGRLRMLARWTVPAVVLAAIALVGHLAALLAGGYGRPVPQLVLDVAPSWVYDVGVRLDGWLPPLPLGDTATGGVFLALTAVCAGLVMTCLYRDTARRSQPLAAVLLTAALLFALYTALASPWHVVFAGTLAVFGVIGAAVIGMLLWIFASVLG